MAILLKRQLTPDEKEIILNAHGRVCFANGHVIAEGENIQFDHVLAYADGGESELNNIAPMCETHNKQKGRLPLADFRVKLRLDDFFSRGDNLTLKHLLLYMKEKGDIGGYGSSVIISQNGDSVEIDTTHDGKIQQPLYTCLTTKWKYFYATLPVTLLDSDDEDEQKIGLQPRYLIYDKVFELYRHFQNHPVLQPSIGRVYQNRIFLFDGQHKAAALLWAGRRNFECKIYLDPDLRKLNQTNVAAHDKFAQTRFFSSIMVLKLGTEFGNDFENYKHLEDSSTKSESGFVKFLQKENTLTSAEVNKRFRSYLFNSVLNDEANQLARYVSNGNRSTDDKPLTLDMLTKSIFANFLFTEPVEEDMTTDAYKREKELNNVIALMNMLYDIALAGWNPKAGANDDNQRKLIRLFRSKSIMAWSEILRDAVCAKLDLDDAEDRARPFYRELSDEKLKKIKVIVERLVHWKFWASPSDSEIDRVTSDAKGQVKQWMKNHQLTTGYLMGAQD